MRFLERIQTVQLSINQAYKKEWCSGLFEELRTSVLKICDGQGDIGADLEICFRELLSDRLKESYNKNVMLCLQFSFHLF